MRLIFGVISAMLALLVVSWLVKTQLQPPQVLKGAEAEALGISIQDGATPAEIQQQYKDKVNELMENRQQQLKDY